MTKMSFLSEDVKYQVRYIREKFSYLNSLESLHKYYECCLDEDLLLNWDIVKLYFAESIEGLKIHENSIEWFNEKIECFFPIYLDSFYHLKSVDNKKLRILIEKYSLWTHRSQEIINLLEHLLTENSTSNLEGVLYFSSILERSLGNVYLLKGKNVPHLLRDLLSTDEIIVIFGNIPIIFTQILLGTPKSLNLRNLVWHGFARNEELHFCYVSILLSIILSFGKILVEKNINVSEIPKRRQFKNLNKFSTFFLLHYNFTLPSIHDIKIILNDNLYLKYEMDLFNILLEFYEGKQNGRFLLLLLPQFENFMRRIFCDVNKMPNSLITAEMNTLYTTLDNIFTLKFENGTSNEIYSVFDSSLIEFYNDLFTYQAGPRFRDRLSHGEINFEDISDEFVQIIFSLVLLFIIKVNILNKNNNFNYKRILLINSLESYHSLYHRNSILKYKILELNEKRNIVLRLPYFNFESQTTETGHVSIISEKFTKYLKQLLNSSKDPFIDFNILHISTKARFDEEAEFVSLLTRIVITTLNAEETIRTVLSNKYELCKKRHLRTRQRNSLNRMLSLIPLLYEYFTCICYIITCFTVLLFQSDPERNKLKNFGGYFKKMLQSVETIESEILLDKNRWDMIKSLVNDCLKSTSHILEQKYFINLLN